jgi:small subunit ribosomal protein S18
MSKEIPMASPDLVKKVFFRSRRTCPLSVKGAPKIDYKDTKLLFNYVSERGKIMPRRITSVSAKKQRELAKAVKRARILALMPFVEQ